MTKTHQSLSLIIGFISAVFYTKSSAAPVHADNLKRSAVVPNLSGSPVVFGAGTYPRANSLSDPSSPAGSIIGAYTAFSGNDNVITTTKSTDGGSSWQDIGTVTSGASNANDIDNPYVLQLPSGRILCAFRNHSKDPATGAYTFFRITITFSDDYGATWAYLSTAASDPGPVNGDWEPFLRNAQDGSLQLYYSRENSADDQDTLERISTDGGQSWSAATTISGADITSRDGMTGVTTVSGATLMAVFESEMDGLFTIVSISSSDDGRAWGNRSTVYTPTGQYTSAGAPQIINVGGTLAVSFMTNEDSPPAAPATSYTSNSAAKLITSGDNGVTWGDKITVGSQQSVWPGLYDLGGANFLMMFDHSGAKAQLISLS